jgi:hypothetical protein
MRHAMRQPGMMDCRGKQVRSLRLARVGSAGIALGLLLAVYLGNAAVASAAKVTADKTDGGVVIQVDGQPYAQYLIRSGAKPIVWPIVGPTGVKMTRNYPMQEEKVVGEKQDHIHHRSLWLTHGNVNGIDFWGEGRGHGNIVHREFVKVTSDGDVATVVTRNDWMSPEGKRVCQDVRRLRFGANEEVRWIDFDAAIHASDGPVTFGDTKEGSFGVRVAGSMKVDLDHGEIINSKGQTNKDAWGKNACWVDYHGLVDGQLVGIAILNHPQSFRYPTYWHVRTYGLFAANPFGLHDFLHRAAPIGNFTLQPGESLSLFYRVILHKGDEKAGNIAKAFVDYAKEPRLKPN